MPHGHLVRPGDTMWVSDLILMGSSTPTTWPPRRGSPARDFDTLQDAGNAWTSTASGPTARPCGWSDLRDAEKIYAYDMATKERASGKDFNFLKAAGNLESQQAVWSNGDDHVGGRPDLSA